jgi:hypothetical protein
MVVTFSQTARIYTYKYFQFQDPPKFTQIWIFGLKRNHLADPEEGGRATAGREKKEVLGR